MKVLRIFVFLVIGFPLFAQQKDTLKSQSVLPSVQSDSLVVDAVADSAFIDLNGNGIDDRLERRIQSRGKKPSRDLFRDEDGDGICDGKESSVGLQKLRKKRMKGKR